MLYAALELQFGYLRAITPCYAQYTIIPRTPAANKAILSDQSPAAKHLQKRWKQGNAKSGCSIKYDIDVIEASTLAAPRDSLAAQISKWEFAGLCETRTAQVRNRYAVLKPLPKDVASRKEIAEKLSAQMLTKEDAEVGRLRQTAALVTAAKCIPQVRQRCFLQAVPTELIALVFVRVFWISWRPRRQVRTVVCRCVTGTPASC